MDNGIVPVMRVALLACALALCACSQAGGPRPVAAAELQPCGSLERAEDLTPAECRMEAGGQTLHVTFAQVPSGADGGNVAVDVLGADGRVTQSLLETNVSEYIIPSVQDIDGDGRADILIPRVTGNVNTEWGVWVNTGSAFRRAGEISGVEVQRTADGYIAAPARSSCCSWNVRYYTLDEGGLHDLVTVSVEGQEELPNGRVRSTCTLSESPGLAALHLDARAGRDKFCAEHASQVFGE